jgi:hypothetical protein
MRARDLLLRLRRRPGLRPVRALRSRGLPAVVVLALLLWAAPARAQSTIHDRSDHDRPADLSLLLGVPIPFGFGAGMRFGIPVAPNGFIGSINDAVFVEPGFQFVFWSDFDRSQVGFEIPILMRWDFFLTRAWTVFGSVGPVFGIWFDRAGGGHGNFEVKGKEIFRPGEAPGFFGVSFGGGALYNFSPDTALRLDASTGMIAVGILFRL